MFVLVKRIPEDAIVGIRGDGVLLDGRGQPKDCDWCMDRPATERFYWYDPDNCTAVSDGGSPFVTPLCTECNEESGGEGYFWCDGCEELHIENYSWELFYTVGEDGIFCLGCGEDYYADNWEAYVASPDRPLVENPHIRLGGHQRPISERWQVLQEYEAVSEWADSPTSMGTVEQGVREFSSTGPVLVAVTNAYQFCADVALVRPKGLTSGEDSG